MTVTIIAVFKLTHAKSNISTNITVLLLFGDERLKVKQCQITSNTKMINMLKFTQNYLFTKYYCTLICTGMLIEKIAYSHWYF